MTGEFSVGPAVGGDARRRTVATLVGAAGVVLWASETALVTFAGDVPPLQIVALAFGVVAALSPLLWWAQGLKPSLVLRQPPGAWALNVAALLVFHACLYCAVQNAPPADAALMQGFTPLAIVVGSALLPGERVRWWHIGGTLAGLVGMIALIANGGGEPGTGRSPAPYLAASAVAAAAWALYSILNRRYSQVPSAAMGGFYGLTALVAGLGHLLFETWVTPSPEQWAAIVALGALPMGLALYCWDHGVKHGDLQALAAFSYSEALLATILVVVLGRGAPSWPLLWSGVLIIGGALLAARGMWHPVAAVAAGDAASEPLADFERVVARHAGELDAAVAAALDRTRAGAAECEALLRAHWPALLQPQAGVVDQGRLARLLELQDESDLRRAYRAVADHLLRLALRRYRWQQHRLPPVLAEISTRLTDDLLFLRGRSRAARDLASRAGDQHGHPLGRLHAEVAAFLAAYDALERQTEALGASAGRLRALAADLAGQLTRTAAAPGRSAEPAGPAGLDRGAAEIVRLLQAVARAGAGLTRAAADEAGRIRASGAHFSLLAGEVTDLGRQTAQALDAVLPRARPPLPRAASRAAQARATVAAPPPGAAARI